MTSPLQRRDDRWLAQAILLILTALPATALSVEPAVPWVCHTIDDSSRGADGVRLADVNGDGLADVATGWEEGGEIRVYLNPGPSEARQPWRRVTVGKVARPEDAVLVDLDADGAVDVVSCCEANIKTVFAHWAPRDKEHYFEADAWRTAAFPAIAGTQMFVFCLPLQVDGRHGIDLVVGSKTKGGPIGWLRSPGDPRDVAAWTWHPLTASRWVMTLAAADFDADGDTDILASDRDGARRGSFWLVNPGEAAAQLEPWKMVRVGPEGQQTTFCDLADLDQDGRVDVLAPNFDRELWFHRRTAAAAPSWQSRQLTYPPQMAFARAVRAADLDLDGRTDLAMTSRGPEGTLGAVWMSHPGTIDGNWNIHDISGPAGPKGLKFDVIELLDLDADGDLDLLTTEEHTGLGVVWFENPARMAR